MRLALGSKFTSEMSIVDLGLRSTDLNWFKVALKYIIFHLLERVA